MPDNKDWIINPLPEIGPINSVVPWTYGDAYSFLEILTETREKMQEILKGFKIQDKHIRDFVNDVSNKINEFVAKFVHHTVTDDENGIIHFAMMNGSVEVYGEGRVVGKDFVKAFRGRGGRLI